MASRKVRVLGTLRRAGAPYVTLRSASVSIVNDYDAGSGEVSSSGGSDVTRVALLMDMLSSKPSNGFGNFDGINTDIEGVKKWAFMDAIGSVPKIQDKILASFVTYDVLNVQTVSDGSGPVLYILALAY